MRKLVWRVAEFGMECSMPVGAKLPSMESEFRRPNRIARCCPWTGFLAGDG